jgi:putative ABC transport system permease protein
VRGYPVVGTTQAFAARWGRLGPQQGRLFAAEGEAVIGAEVNLALGDAVTPSHGTADHRSPFGVETPEEATHRHAGVVYRVVGRLPRLGSPWDRAILVPIESVWETHGLGNGHAKDGAPLGPPYDAEKVPGVPAIVVKPVSVAGAYALRGIYRQGGTTALFPAEVLVTLYRTLGDVRDVLVTASLINDALIFAAMTMLLVALAGLRRRRYAVLRALGASRGYVLLTVWLSGAVILAAGCVGAVAVGGVATAIVAQAVEARTGLHLAVTIGMADLAVVAGLIAVASVMALGPAVAALRIAVAQILRGA